MRTSCLVHGSPLMRWRKVRDYEECVLPFIWTIDPGPRRANACPWLNDDLRFVNKFLPDRCEPDSPWGLVRRFGEDVTEVDSVGRKWSMRWNWSNLRIIAALQAGAQRANVQEPAVAESLRPVGADSSILFGEAPSGQTQLLLRRYQFLACYPLAWRRSLIWFATKYLYPTSRSVRLANGMIVPGGGTDSWYEIVASLPGGPMRQDFNAFELTLRLQWHPTYGNLRASSVTQSIPS